MNTATTQQQVIELLNDTIENVDFTGFLSSEDFTTFEEVRDLLEDNGALNIEIIYYSDAMRYLMQNDNSLRNSLELAADFGYELKNLNSETLASLLASENARTEFYQLESEINSILN
jgi:intracellular sulfur oxidation DsrE/DsrF family protein